MVLSWLVVGCAGRLDVQVPYGSSADEYGDEGEEAHHGG
jgi:hypothetical protein